MPLATAVITDDVVLGARTTSSLFHNLATASHEGGLCEGPALEAEAEAEAVSLPQRVTQQ